MTDQCSICYEHMDMKSFKDSNTSTTTCVKLECEHAYHTTCIITVLNKTNAQCPLCGKNKVSDEVTREGLLKKIFSSAKRNPEIKQSIQEFKESFSSYKELIKQLKIETEEFIINRMKETNFKQNRTYLIKTMDNVRCSVRRYAKNMGDKFLANEYGIPSNKTFDLLSGDTKNFAAARGVMADDLINLEKEVIGTGLDFKRIGKVKNDIGGYDHIVKPRQNYTQNRTFGPGNNNSGFFNFLNALTISLADFSSKC